MTPYDDLPLAFLCLRSLLAESDFRLDAGFEAGDSLAEAAAPLTLTTVDMRFRCSGSAEASCWTRAWASDQSVPSLMAYLAIEVISDSHLGEHARQTHLDRSI